ncbi:MAG: hypothetical protein LBD58_03010 [Treponema sp.]|jgi:hypothetical protein|nr:hypothetical protein [Treponema sp.]
MAKKYWVTTQWPHDRDAGEEPHENICAADGKGGILSSIQEGDIVFIYETKRGKHPVESPPLQTGCQSVVTIAEVKDTVESNDDPPTEYTDGTSISWKYFVEASAICSDGRVCRAELNGILGYSPDYNLHGFGTNHSGVMEIDITQARKLKTIFCKNPVDGAECPCEFVI